MILIKTRRGRETRAFSSKCLVSDDGRDDKCCCDVEGWQKDGLSSSWLLLGNGDVFLRFLGSANTVNDLLDLVIMVLTHTKCQWSLELFEELTLVLVM